MDSVKCVKYSLVDVREKLQEDVKRLCLLEIDQLGQKVNFKGPKRGLFDRQMVLRNL